MLDVSMLEFHSQNLERLGWTSKDTLDLLAFIQDRLNGHQMIISDTLIWNVIGAKTREKGLYAVVEKDSA